jgi:type IV secretory pathway VirB4 component
VTTGSLVLVDVWQYDSHNEFVVGMTGMGKTTYLIMDMLREWMNGTRIFVIDPDNLQRCEAIWRATYRD